MAPSPVLWPVTWQVIRGADQKLFSFLTGQAVWSCHVYPQVLGEDRHRHGEFFPLSLHWGLNLGPCCTTELSRPLLHFTLRQVWTKLSTQALNLSPTCSVPGIAVSWHQIQLAYWILTWRILAPLLYFVLSKKQSGVYEVDYGWLVRDKIFPFLLLHYFLVPLILLHRKKMFMIQTTAFWRPNI